MKKLFLIVIAVVISGALFAQVNPKPKTKKDARRERVNALLKMEEEGELVFRKQSIFGFKATSDGYGISYEIGKFRSNRNTFLLQFELKEIIFFPGYKGIKLEAIKISGYFRFLFILAFI